MEGLARMEWQNLRNAGGKYSIPYHVIAGVPEWSSSEILGFLLREEGCEDRMLRLDRQKGRTKDFEKGGTRSLRD